MALIPSVYSSKKNQQLLALQGCQKRRNFLKKTKNCLSLTDEKKHQENLAKSCEKLTNELKNCKNLAETNKRTSEKIK